MANPKGHLETLQPFTKIYQGEDALSSQPLAVKVPKTIDRAVRRLPNKAEWLRRVISEAAQAEGLV